MNKCNLHTILRLPTGIFYAQGVKTNVLFFTRGKTDKHNTKEVWIYDLRNDMPSFGKTNPLKSEHFDDFVECYCSGHMADRKPTYSEDNPNGRWRCFSEEEVKKADTLDFKWLDLEEKDERTIQEVLKDMESEAEGITVAVSKLKELLGGVEL